MNKELLDKIELLNQKIENNTATVEDYHLYENLLSQGGLSHDKINSFLVKSGFNNWNEFYQARNNIKKTEKVEAGIVGGLIGLGLGLLIAALFDD